MTNKEACLIIDEFERYHRGDISDEQEEAFTLASRLLSRIPDDAGVICILHGDKKMTNGEIIRKLLNGCDIADEKLAKIRICPYNVSETCNIDMECDDCRLKWLKKDCSDFQPCANDILD